MCGDKLSDLQLITVKEETLVKNSALFQFVVHFFDTYCNRINKISKHLFESVFNFDVFRTLPDTDNFNFQICCAKPSKA